MPALNAFASGATVFANCLAQSATTVTAVPALLTGKFPVTDRLLKDLTLQPNEPTIVTALHAAGYRTMAVIAHEFAACRYSGCAGFDGVDDYPGVYEPAAATGVRAIRMLETARPEPFFLWVHVRQPHQPYDATREEFTAAYDGPPAPTFFSPLVSGRSFPDAVSALAGHYHEAAGEPLSPVRMLQRHALVTPTVLRQLEALYDANVRAGDRVFSQVLDWLGTHELRDRTVVVAAADHGEALGTHGWFGHNRLWHDMLHTPLVIAVPGARPEVVEAPVMNVDIAPTIARLVDVPLGYPVRGRDLFAVAPPGRVQYAEYPTEWVLTRDGMKVSVERDELRGLYDLRRDPTEAQNLARVAPEQAAGLLALGAELRRQTLAHDPTRTSPDLFERLRQLGYVDVDPATKERADGPPAQ
jgi:arylsulfatase A-like enzyme